MQNHRYALIWKFCVRLSRCAARSPARFRGGGGGVLATVSAVLVFELSAGFTEMCFMASLNSSGIL